MFFCFGFNKIYDLLHVMVLTRFVHIVLSGLLHLTFQREANLKWQIRSLKANKFNSIKSTFHRRSKVFVFCSLPVLSTIMKMLAFHQKATNVVLILTRIKGTAELTNNQNAMKSRALSHAAKVLLRFSKLKRRVSARVPDKALRWILCRALVSATSLGVKSRATQFLSQFWRCHCACQSISDKASMKRQSTTFFLFK